jgi:hypothetical protein
MIKARLFRLGEWCDETEKRSLIDCKKTRTFKNRQQMKVENSRIKELDRHYHLWVEESKFSSFNII